MSDSTSLLVIGAGLAGYMFAKEWRKLDKTTSLTIITNDHGDYYSKPLLSTALKNNKTANSLPINNAAEMAEQLDAKIIINCEVTAIDAINKMVKADDDWHGYEQLVLAVGSTPIHLMLKGDAVERVHSINDLKAYSKFRAHLQPNAKVIIVGSGLVGCEFANDLILSGYQVDVVSLDNQPLHRLAPPLVGRSVEQSLADKGVVWHFNEVVKAVDLVPNGLAVVCESGLELVGQNVLSAIGIKPEVALAKAAVLTVSRGIVVDSYMQTSDPNIFALGDCVELNAQLKQYVAPLLHAGRCLAKTIAGEKTECIYPVMPVQVKTTLCPVVVVHPVEKNG